MMGHLAASLMMLMTIVAANAQELRPRPTEWAQPMIGSSLDNFYRVDDKLYRSAQPGDGEMEEIEEFGIEHVLSLREYHFPNT